MTVATRRVTQLLNGFSIETRHKLLLGLVLAGLVVRLALFHDVAVNGDTGLYLYDAKQVLWGRRLMIDFASRSPLMEHLLAAVIWLGDSPIVSARMFMLSVGLALGVANYVFGAQLYSPTAGLAAAALFYLTPFSAVWGLWVKTEQVAGLLALLALILTVNALRTNGLWRYYAPTIGVLFGSAFLVRRVVIIHMGVFGLFLLWYAYQHDQSVVRMFSVGVLTAASAVTTMAVAYLLVARGSPSLAWSVADQHAVALFSSSGQGSLGWIELTDPKPATAESRDVWYSAICQKCGDNTVRVFTRTMLATLPVVMISLIFLRSWLLDAGEIFDTILLGMVSVGGLLAAWAAFNSGYIDRAIGALALVVTIAYLVVVGVPDFDRFRSPFLALPILVLVGLAAGYLYRDRILYVTYFQDFYPYLAVIAGVSLVEFVRAMPADRRHAFCAVGLLLLVPGMAVAGANAYPHQPDAADLETHWHTIDSVQKSGADIQERTEPGDRIMTAQPLYVIESDRRLSADLSRKYYLFRGWPDSEQTQQLERELVDDLDGGAVPYVINDTDTATVLNHSDAVRKRVDQDYCRVEAPVYEQTGGELHERYDRS